MLNLPTFMMVALDPFAQIFWGNSTWYRAQELVVGALPATGKRRVTSVLRALSKYEAVKVNSSISSEAV